MFTKDQLEVIKHAIFFEFKRHYLDKTALRYARSQDAAEQILLKAPVNKFVISDGEVKDRQNVLRKVIFQLEGKKGK